MNRSNRSCWESENCPVPTYTYECKKCFTTFDLFHSMSANPRVKCTECGGPCRRLIGRGAGVIFKGSGFYETDYKRKSGAGGGKTDGKGKAEAKPETTKETKSESKAEPKGGAKGTDKAGKAAKSN